MNCCASCVQKTKAVVSGAPGSSFLFTHTMCSCLVDPVGGRGFLVRDGAFLLSLANDASQLGKEVYDSTQMESRHTARALSSRSISQEIMSRKK